MNLSLKQTAACVLFIFVILTAMPVLGADPPPIPKRVISLSPIITETIYLVGAQDRLIANTTYCTVPLDAQTKEKIGSVTQMNVEKILRLNPDLVIASALSSEKQLQVLEKIGVPVIRARNPATFDEMCEMTLDLGRTLGHPDQAARIIDRAREQVAQIQAATRPLEKPTVFLQIGIKPLHSANREMFINEYIAYGGGINIAADEGTGVYSREKVLAMDPDVILIATMGTSTKAGRLEQEKWMAHDSMTAVARQRVHVLDPELICSPTPETFGTGLRQVALLLHPSLAGRDGFKDNDPGKKVPEKKDPLE